MTIRKMTLRKRAIVAALALAGAVCLPVVATAADFTMKLSSPVPPTEKDVVYAWMTAFETGVEEASKGRIDVQLYPANQLGQIPATIEGVAMGTIEMTLPIIGFLGALDTRFGVLDAAGLFDDEAHAMRTFQDPDVRAMLAGFGQRANVEPLVLLLSGQGVVVASNPIDEASDFKGLKIRTGGATPLLNRPLEKLGASPVALPLGEVLPALQTGAIDASSANMAVLNAFQFQDVATEATYLPGNFTIVGGLVSKDFLATIGPELEAIVRQQAREAESVFETYIQHGPAELEATWQQNGGVIRQLDATQAQAYLAVVQPEVESIVAQDPQMQRDYDMLKAAAARNR